MKIREFKIEDTETVVTLWTECDLVKPWNNPYKDITTKLTQGADLFLVAEVGSTIVASVMGGYEGHRGWANYLVVEPSMQGNGYGQQLMAELEQRLKAKGCPKINLQVRASNTQVIDFYISQGFQVDDSVSLGKRLDGVTYQA